MSFLRILESPDLPACHDGGGLAQHAGLALTIYRLSVTSPVTQILEIHVLCIMTQTLRPILQHYPLGVKRGPGNCAVFSKVILVPSLCLSDSGDNGPWLGKSPPGRRKRLESGARQRGACLSGRDFTPFLNLSDHHAGEPGAEMVMASSIPGPGLLISISLCPLFKHETHQKPGYTLGCVCVGGTIPPLIVDTLIESPFSAPFLCCFLSLIGLLRMSA